MKLNKITVKAGLLGISLSLTAVPILTLAATTPLPEEPTHGSITVTKQQGKGDLAKLATVSKADAIKAASKIAPGKVTEAELGNEKNFLVWKVETRAANGAGSEVLIDAGNGEALALEQETGKPEQGERREKGERG